MQVEEERIDEIVNELAKVLSDRNSVFENDKHIVRYEDEPFFGWELILCNIHTVKGQPIDKQRVYYMPMPVFHIPDHRSKMRVAFYTGGRAAVMKYLEKFFNKETVDRCRAIILGKYNEYVQSQYVATQTR